MTPLELFFDLVFVLAITQCTTLMSHHPTWAGLGQGMLVLALLWWSWVGYAWLTSVVDPEEGAVRIVIFGAMAALPDRRALRAGGLRRPRAGLRARLRRRAGRAHRPLHARQPRRPTLPALGARPRRQHRDRRRAPDRGLVPRPGRAGRALGRSRWSSTWAGPTSSASEGWKLVPGHFAERHGLIVIIALGESIVAIGRRRRLASLTWGIAGAAVLGIAVVAAMWWTYFDIVALVSARRLARRPGGPGAERARPRLLLLHPLPDGRRDRPLRPRA